jgi:hypothetical protein
MRELNEAKKKKEAKETRKAATVMRTAPLLLLLAVAACAGAPPGKGTVDVAPKVALTGPKEVAIMGTRTEVVAALEDALSAHGFTFRHYRSRDRAAAPVGEAPMGENPADNTKYAIEVTSDVYDHCIGGGFILTSLRVSVIDRSSNELMLRTTAKGRTEKCPPISGSVFRDIADAINAAWQK